MVKSKLTKKKKSGGYTDLYAKAVEAGKGCPIFLKRTHEYTLKVLPIETLKKHAIDIS